jgi:hypothetical protein
MTRRMGNENCTQFFKVESVRSFVRQISILLDRTHHPDCKIGVAFVLADGAEVTLDR